MKTRYGASFAACVVQLAFALTGAAAPPVALEAVTALDRLPELRRGVRTYQASSHDPSGGNGDTGHFRQVLGSEQVLLDVAGPGCVYRIWLTGQSAQGLIRVYFDQSAIPAVQMTLGEFFSGTAAPFLSPLVGNDAVSSGGFYCYLPLPFRTGCRITTTGGGHYYNITYQLYADDAGITTFTGAEDAAAARLLWLNAGSDPKIDTGQQLISREFQVPAGQAVTAAEITGPGSIQSLEIRLPGMQVPDSTPVTDDGRAFKGKVNFAVAVDPQNQGVRLVRRIDYGICDQKGAVYVNGAAAGEWYTPGSSGGGMFYDAVFDLPAALTTGRSSLNIEIRFISACLDWNEFYYWVHSLVDGAYVLTDTLDVGNAVSEAAHQYVITNENWRGTRTYSYYVAATGPFREVLQKTRLRMHWDGASSPSVDAPLALFFGAGTGPARVRSLPVGIRDDRLYCYFPMPFASNARVEILNQGSQAISPLQFLLRHTPRPEMPADAGYFHAVHREEKPTTSGRDYTVLDVSGTGHFVGLVQMMHSADGSRGYLEGDERIHVDANPTPALYGTGTEDLYNGGWYFNRGVFTLPVHGNPVHEVNPGDTTVAYRFFLSDLIPFDASIRVGIEHGAVNDINNDISSVAFYYARPEAAALITDELDVGTVASETQHNYSTTPPAPLAALSHTYEGDDDNVSISDQGRSIPVGGSSTFSIAIERGCARVLLRRRMDYGVAHQAARVFVDGALAGTWYDAGSNSAHRFRDSEFLIPTALIANRSRLTLRIENASPGSAWTEYRYQAFSIGRPSTRLVRPDFDGDGDVDLEDWGHLQACLTGSAASQLPEGCEDAVFDGDRDVDLYERSVFLKCFKGPQAAPPEDCDP